MAMNRAQAEQAEQAAQMMQMQRLIKSADYITCDSCNALNFVKITRIKRISGLAAGTGKDMIVPMEVYACADCGTVNKMFLERFDVDEDEEGIAPPAHEKEDEAPKSSLIMP